MVTRKTLLLIVLVSTTGFCQLKTLRPGFNLFTPAQDIQVGQQAKLEVEKTKPLVRDSQVNGYITELGKRLAASPKAGQFPFSFEGIHDDAINGSCKPLLEKEVMHFEVCAQTSRALVQTLRACDSATEFLSESVRQPV